MKEYQYIETTGPENEVATICLNRPELHNAFNIEMIRELLHAIAVLNSNDKTRIILIKARGEHFSAGADLAWMKEGIDQPAEKLKSESAELAQLFKAIYESEKITMALASGKVIGGANGILAAADIVISGTEASFTFSEAKLGLIPATVAPYVIQKTGTSVAREWFLTARTISANEAYTRGLVHHLVGIAELEQKSEELCKLLLRNGPGALSSIKKLMQIEGMGQAPNNFLEETVELLAEKRISAEAQEGILAFFEKRKPGWINESQDLQ